MLYGNAVVTMLYGNAVITMLYGNAVVTMLYGNAVVAMLYGNAVITMLYGNAVVTMLYGNAVTPLYCYDSDQLTASYHVTTVTVFATAAPRLHRRPQAVQLLSLSFAALPKMCRHQRHVAPLLPPHTPLQ